MPSSNPPITGSGISAVTVSGSPVQVFYQFSDGYAGESIFNTGGGWSQDELQISPGYSSPMASVSWDNQGEASGFLYLFNPQPDICIGRFVFTTSTPPASSKNIATLAAQVGMLGTSAVVFTKQTQKPVLPLLRGPTRTWTFKIFVFTTKVSTIRTLRVTYLLKRLKAAENDDVLELTFSGSWSPGSLSITNALSTTNLAAVTYYSDGQQQINLYYQAEDLSLGEYVNDGSGWSEGQLIGLV